MQNSLPEPAIVAPGYDFNDGEFVPCLLTSPLQKDSSAGGEGQPITLVAAQEMVGRYHQLLRNRLTEAREKGTEDEILDEVVAVTFGKETLLLLLSQAGCEGIRFYLCKNQDHRTSLVMVGIDGERSDLSATGQKGVLLEWSAGDPYTFMDEVGGPKTLRDFKSPVRDFVGTNPLVDYVRSTFDL